MKRRTVAWMLSVWAWGCGEAAVRPRLSGANGALNASDGAAVLDGAGTPDDTTTPDEADSLASETTSDGGSTPDAPADTGPIAGSDTGPIAGSDAGAVASTDASSAGDGNGGAPGGDAANGGSAGVNPKHLCNFHCGKSVMAAGGKCYCDAKCKTNNDCCSVNGLPLGNSCSGSSCGACQ
jgi:hypothetical protein